MPTTYQQAVIDRMRTPGVPGPSRAPGATGAPAGHMVGNQFVTDVPTMPVQAPGGSAGPGEGPGGLGGNDPATARIIQGSAGRAANPVRAAVDQVFGQYGRKPTEDDYARWEGYNQQWGNPGVTDYMKMRMDYDARGDDSYGKSGRAQGVPMQAMNAAVGGISGGLNGLIQGSPYGNINDALSKLTQNGQVNIAALLQQLTGGA